MTAFDDREKAFEKKFEREEEARFKAASRAAHLFGLWVGEQLGLKGAALEAYAREMIDMTVAKKERGSLIARAEENLKAKGIVMTRHRLEHEMEDFYLDAQRQASGKD